MVSAEGLRIVIVGGGASGTLCAIRLLQSLGRDSEVLILDTREKLGQGIAYSTTCEAHLLNVRAAGMTAFPEEPDHFTNWLANRRRIAPDEARPQFAQRREYAAYLQELLTRAIDNSEAKFTHVQDCAETFDGRKVTTRSGDTYAADKLILALGNRSPKLPAVIQAVQDERVCIDPWSMAARPARTDRVLLIGAGLTMIDTVLQLKAEGHTGPITAISRNGWMPAVHTTAKPAAPFDPSSATIRQVLHRIKTAGKMATHAGEDWRSLIDSIRPHAQKTWVSLSTKERLRFTKRLQTLWDIHRHRVAPSIHSHMQSLQAQDELTVLAGRIQAIKPSDAGLIVSFKGGAGEQSILVDRIINCTGPNPDWINKPNPFIQNLVDQDLITYDDLGFGVSVDPNYLAGENIYAIGPMCRGTLWETTAMPEIRVQAKAITEHILSRDLVSA